MNKVLYFIKHPRFLCIALFEKFGGWIPDKFYLQIVYRLHTGKKLHLNPPVTFNEKLQWLKLYDRKPLYTQLVDKSLVKGYVSKLIGDEYIIPTLGIWNKPEEIDYDILPKKFVLKTTHDGGSSGVIICDKASMDKCVIVKRLRKSLKHNIYKTLREWPYKNIHPRVMAEIFVPQFVNQSPGLTDYKFFCFNGEPYFCQVKTHSDGKDSIDLFDMDWNLLPFTGLNPTQKHAKETPIKPINFERMVSLVKKLCNIAAFERVDLYNVDGRIYFGEITFYPVSGMGIFTPDSYDKILGDYLIIY